MLNNGKGTVIVWSYNENDVVNYVRAHADTVIETQYGNWETGSESWKKVFVVKRNKIA